MKSVFFYVLIISFLLTVGADEDSQLIPPKDLPKEKQIEKLEEMSDAVSRNIEPTSAPVIPAPNLTQEEKVEQLKEMSDGSFFSRELTKKLATVQSTETTNLTKLESEILAEEITRRLDTEVV